jgi:hypothetical protein
VGPVSAARGAASGGLRHDRSPATTSTISSTGGRTIFDFLRRFAPFHFGILCERWLRTLLNRIDPILFKRCFESWVAEM